MTSAVDYLENDDYLSAQYLRAWSVGVSDGHPPRPLIQAIPIHAIPIDHCAWCHSAEELIVIGDD